MKIQKPVLIQTRNIALGELVLCALMCIIFAICGYFDYTVILGALYGGAWAVLNFFLMGLAVQKAAAAEEGAKGIIQRSYALRSFLTLAVAAAGILLPCFHFLAALLPLFFPQLTVYILRALKLDQK